MTLMEFWNSANAPKRTPKEQREYDRETEAMADAAYERAVAACGSFRD